MDIPYYIVANDTVIYTAKCKVVHPIIVPEEVYLRVETKGWNFNFYTGGKKVTDNKPRNGSNHSASWVDEYEFEIELNTNMTGIKCLGMDLNNGGDWRRSNFKNFNYDCKSQMEWSIKF